MEQGCNPDFLVLFFSTSTKKKVTSIEWIKNMLNRLNNKTFSLIFS